MTERAEVIVVGGGQAGLVAGYYLSRAEIPFVILDAQARVGDAWRRRWDTLELFTTGRYSSLPGLQFPGDSARFPGKNDVADYLEQYARTFKLPIRLDNQVTTLARADRGYRIEAAAPGPGRYHADHVIVATGAYQRPYTPPLAERLSDAVLQLHSAEYRNPAQVPRGTVLVVGAANSGLGIAEDLAATHRVHLSRGSRLPRLPRRLFGKSLHYWGDHLGLIGAPFHTLRGRTQRGELVVGSGPRQLARRHGVQLHPRTVDVEARRVSFENGGAIHVDAVVWATGYRSDYSWIDVPVFDERGAPRHQRGLTDLSGLYFLGMHGQYSRGSSLIHWVKDDASYIVDQVRTAASGSGARDNDDPPDRRVS
jgi:putative flavoprotein involved in K+ transport